MVSYSNSFFENDIKSIIILIAVINFLPTVLKNYIGPQFLKAANNNDIIRNFCVLVSIIALVYLSNYEDDKLLASSCIFLFLLVFSRQTILFNIIEILLLLYIFTLYTKNQDLEYYIYLLVVIMLVGYEVYYKKQVGDKGLKFSFNKFIFGKREREYDREYIQFNPL
tara:strand:+ start:117 stop:617 length:501 start_codon:yes stop_codon:yes gene_type:complete